MLYDSIRCVCVGGGVQVVVCCMTPLDVCVWGGGVQVVVCCMTPLDVCVCVGGVQAMTVVVCCMTPLDVCVCVWEGYKSNYCS